MLGKRYNTSVGVDVWQHNNAALAQDLVALRSGGAIGSFHHVLGVHLPSRVGIDNALDGRRHKDVARDAQDRVLVDRLPCTQQQPESIFLDLCGAFA